MYVMCIYPYTGAHVHPKAAGKGKMPDVAAGVNMGQGAVPAAMCSAQQARSFSTTRETAEEVRCALDLGSGATKMLTGRYASGKKWLLRM